MVDRRQPADGRPLRSSLISIAIAVGEGEAYYFPLRHTLSQSVRVSCWSMPLVIDLLPMRRKSEGSFAAATKYFRSSGPERKPNGDSQGIAAKMLRNNRRTDDPQSSGARLAGNEAAAESARGSLGAQNSAEREVRYAGTSKRGRESGRARFRHNVGELRAGSWPAIARPRCSGARVPRSHHDILCGPLREGPLGIPFDECPIEAARDYSCEDADMALRLREIFEPQLESHELTRLA